MLTKLHYTVSQKLLQDAESIIPQAENRYLINEPTGRFFYDPWTLKEEYQNTVWETIMKTLPGPAGEARIMVLKPGTAYNSHADADDRYHLNINGESCYLIDLDNNELYKLIKDGSWYEMDAGRIHTATNFGRYYRIQLVVRKLLVDHTLLNSTKVKIVSNGISDNDARFIFDNVISPWLNRANKNKIISNFNYVETEVTFNIDNQYLNELESIMPKQLRLIK